MTTLKPSVFVKAEKELVERTEKYPGRPVGCCDRMDWDGAELAFFKSFFKPSQAPLHWWPDFSEKSQLARSIALLLCAEMARDLEK